jgi:large subunit ribosomal protein L10
MAVTKAKKSQILTVLKDQIAIQKAVVLLTTNEAKDTINSSDNALLRRFCYDNQLDTQVVKNTLIQKAFPSITNLVGQTYVISHKSSDVDEVSVPKAIINIITNNKEFNDKLSVKGSIINGEFYDRSATVALSKVPSFNDSMAMIAGSINQITAKIAIAVQEIPASLARVIQSAKAE